MRTRSIQAFHDELVRAVSLGADFLVAHPGSGLGTDKEQAISEIAQGMRQAARGMKLGGLRILVENTSGMGSAVGARFEEIKAILDQTGDLPMGVCLDTAHTLEAGYDITTQKGWRRRLPRWIARWGWIAFMCCMSMIPKRRLGRASTGTNILGAERLASRRLAGF